LNKNYTEKELIYWKVFQTYWQASSICRHFRATCTHSFIACKNLRWWALTLVLFNLRGFTILVYLYISHVSLKTLAAASLS